MCRGKQLTFVKKKCYFPFNGHSYHWRHQMRHLPPQTNTQGYHMETIWALMWYPYGLAQQGAWCVCSRYSTGTYMGRTRWPTKNPDGYLVCLLMVFEWDLYGAQQGAWCVCSRYSTGTYMGCTRWPTKNPDGYLVCLLMVFQWDLYGDMYCSPDIQPFPPPSCTWILSISMQSPCPNSNLSYLKPIYILSIVYNITQGK